MIMHQIDHLKYPQAVSFYFKKDLLCKNIRRKLCKKLLLQIQKDIKNLVEKNPGIPAQAGGVPRSTMTPAYHRRQPSSSPNLSPKHIHLPSIILFCETSNVLDASHNSTSIKLHEQYVTISRCTIQKHCFKLNPNFQDGKHSSSMVNIRYQDHSIASTYTRYIRYYITFIWWLAQYRQHTTCS